MIENSRAKEKVATSWTLQLSKQNVRMQVSDTHKAHRSGSPGHHAGTGQELDSSVGVESCRSCFEYGEQCFQFLS
jgi:hypothetical protein